MSQESFIPQLISKTSKIILSDSIQTIFPLFGPIEEKKWADGWNPMGIHPASEIVQEGMTFKTEANGYDETYYQWVIINYRPEDYFVEYHVSTPNRFWIITVECEELPANETLATITYKYAGLNSLGNEINKRALEAMYARNLLDWQEAINHFVKTGTLL